MFNKVFSRTPLTSRATVLLDSTGNLKPHQIHSAFKENGFSLSLDQYNFSATDSVIWFSFSISSEQLSRTPYLLLGDPTTIWKAQVMYSLHNKELIPYFSYDHLIPKEDSLKLPYIPIAIKLPQIPSGTRATFFYDSLQKMQEVIPSKQVPYQTYYRYYSVKFQLTSYTCQLCLVSLCTMYFYFLQPKTKYTSPIWLMSCTLPLLYHSKAVTLYLIQNF